MIYSYTYLSHDIQKFHVGINSFFGKMIDLDVPEFDETQHVDSWFLPAVNASKTLLLGNLKMFVQEYYQLADAEKANLKVVFEANQNIKELCCGNGTPMKFSAITNENFRDHLKDFYETLWKRLGNKNTGVNQEVEALCGKVHTHYQDWRKLPEHKGKLCPFCGLSGLFPPDSPHRPAYDHYLPKSEYPFIAVNFENLVPMCHNCNSYEKTTTDPLEDEGVRRIVFYPYDPLPENHFEAKIIVDEAYSLGEYSTRLNAIQWHFDFFSSGAHEVRLDAWDSIFRLKERYVGELKEQESNWFEDIKLKFREKPEGQSFSDFKEKYLRGIHRAISTSERSIVRFAYAKYLLNEVGIEEDLKLLVAA